jgi:hypothetical protein
MMRSVVRCVALTVLLLRACAAWGATKGTEFGTLLSCTGAACPTTGTVDDVQADGRFQLCFQFFVTVSTVVSIGIENTLDPVAASAGTCSSTGGTSPTGEWMPVSGFSCAGAAACDGFIKCINYPLGRYRACILTPGGTTVIRVLWKAGGR